MTEELKAELQELKAENEKLRGQIKTLTQQIADPNVTSDLWRNIHYGTAGHRRLQVYPEPAAIEDPHGAPLVTSDGQVLKESGSLEFGDCFEVQSQTQVGDVLWLQIRGKKNGWVMGTVGRAPDPVLINCINLTLWKTHEGPIPPAAFEGQDFPAMGMYTAGYPGRSEICVASASGSAFWRELNIAMLFADIGTSTVFEQAWGGSENFQDWVAYYASNCEAYGKLRSEHPKHLVVVVNHTENWKKYPVRGPDVEQAKVDIGRAQYHECIWLRDMHKRLGLKWESVTFTTAFKFLQEHAKWTRRDFQEAAIKRVKSDFEGGDGKKAFEKLTGMERTYVQKCARWCIEEAFPDGPPAETQDLLEKMEGMKVAIVPPDLDPGAHYRLVFVTSTSRDATATDIGTYNAFAVAAAATNPELTSLSTTWTCIGSAGNRTTSAYVNANQNTLTRTSDQDAPIYRLDGVRVADGNTHLWGGSLAHPISIDENGDALSTKGGPGPSRDWFLGDTAGDWVYYGLSTCTGSGKGGSAWVDNLDQTKNS
eukprot:CAMPEP_0170583534 /NCGR_PEP_ID=MMETSP0224-20130122/8188_1 /TAXON_ID=285029 /ORGANISM="Togula jolla, Strain CCCM 725" /LENGTH=536 /DNA_ID=CAMNT_0010906871 /DNA_START=65 /DNA_END=1673 /DNA_ORIENTATION=+